MDSLVGFLRESVHVDGDGASARAAVRTRVDARLVPVAVAGWLCTLVVPILPIVPAAGGAVVAALAGVVLLCREGREDPRTGGIGLPAAVACLGAAVLTAVTLLHMSAARSGPVPALAADASVATIELMVRTDPLVRPSRGHRSTYVVLQRTSSVLRVKAPLTRRSRTAALGGR
ncbi:hypothetical protein [Actinopolymorpha rutila]|uniref:Uncharacterized protein n=1 Tax=Actinopolymorpha rutila TaxID=446787 RepID=A0A852ZV31_9ACTN|nr:hypothetical protein [Actinopolymorpha rutila]NYH92830.1 hypothetical protein [Actinopolymorpha rutila]